MFTVQCSVFGVQCSMSVEWENDRSNSWHRLSSHDIEELRRTFNFPENRCNENDDLIFCNNEKLVQNRSKITFSQAQFYMKCHAQLHTVFDKFSVKKRLIRNFAKMFVDFHFERTIC